MPSNLVSLRTDCTLETRPSNVETSVFSVCRPLPLETSASEEMTIIDNIALFERNGFRFTVRRWCLSLRTAKLPSWLFSNSAHFLTA